MRFLRTNTATRVSVGPFIGTDGLTPSTSLTVTSEKLTFTCDTAGVPTLILDTAPTASGGSNDMVHISGDDAGMYDLELAAADVNYLGRAMLMLTNASAHVPVWHEFMILPAMIYDSIVLGTDRLDTNVTHVGDTAQTGADLAAKMLSYIQSICRNDVTADAAIGGTFASVNAALQAFYDDRLTAAAIANQVTGQTKLTKNVAFANFPFELRNLDGTLADTVLASSVTCIIQKDTGNFAAVTATPVAKTNGGNKTGAFRVDLSQSEMNFNAATFIATATGCRPTLINIITQA